MFSNEGFTWLWTPILVNTSKTRFLLDPWTIIVYPCHKLLTDWPTESILFFRLVWCGSWWRKTPTPTCFLLLLLLPTAWRQLDDNLFKTAWFYKRQPKHSTHGSVVPLAILSYSSFAGYMMIGLVIFWNAPCNQKWFRVLIKSDCRIFLSIELRSLQLNSKVNWFWNYWNTKIAKAALVSWKVKFKC